MTAPTRKRITEPAPTMQRRRIPDLPYQPQPVQPFVLLGYDTAEMQSMLMRAENQRVFSQGGRPPKYHPAICGLVFKLRLLGTSNVHIADVLGVTEATLHMWKTEHPEFTSAWDAGGEEADANVAKSMYHRALGYSHEAVKIFPPTKDRDTEIVTYTEHYPPDTEAGKFFLTNRQRGRWKQRSTEEHTGVDGTALQPPTIVINPVQAVQVNVRDPDKD